MECRLEFIYHTMHETCHYIARHKHECYELVYYIKGTGTTEIGGKSFAYVQNSFTVIPPGTCHDERHATDTEVLFIGFGYVGKAFPIKAGQYFDDIQCSFLNCLKQMKKEITDQKLHFEVKLNLLLTGLLIEYERMTRNTAKKAIDFTYIRNYLDENYNQNIDLNALAELSGYSYHHFRHLFKEKTGLPPNQYIINQRICNARRLLKETGLTMIEISQMCGFYSESQFSAMFKKSAGMKPSEYRNKVDTTDLVYE